MTTSTPEKTDGLKALQDAIDKIKETITLSGGVFNVQMAVSYTKEIDYDAIDVYRLSSLFPPFSFSLPHTHLVE